MGIGEIREKIRGLFRPKSQTAAPISSQPEEELAQDQTRQQIAELDQKELAIRQNISGDLDITGASRLADAERIRQIEKSRRDLQAKLPKEEPEAPATVTSRPTSSAHGEPVAANTQAATN